METDGSSFSTDFVRNTELRVTRQECDKYIADKNQVVLIGNLHMSVFTLSI